MDQQGRDVRFVPKADIGTGTRVSLSTQQLRQLGDIGRDRPRLVLCEQLGLNIRFKNGGQWPGCNASFR